LADLFNGLEHGKRIAKRCGRGKRSPLIPGLDST
jgi:hypothetical protein